MKDTLTLIKKQTKTQEKPVITDKRRLRPNDVNTLITDNSKAKKLLHWKPKTTFEEDLAKNNPVVPQKPQTMGIRKTWMAMALLTLIQQSHTLSQRTAYQDTKEISKAKSNEKYLKVTRLRALNKARLFFSL